MSFAVCRQIAEVDFLLLRRMCFGWRLGGLLDNHNHWRCSRGSCGSLFLFPSNSFLVQLLQLPRSPHLSLIFLAFLLLVGLKESVPGGGGTCNSTSSFRCRSFSAPLFMISGWLATSSSPRGRIAGTVSADNLRAAPAAEGVVGADNVTACALSGSNSERFFLPPNAPAPPGAEPLPPAWAAGCGSNRRASSRGGRST